MFTTVAADFIKRKNIVLVCMGNSAEDFFLVTVDCVRFVHVPTRPSTYAYVEYEGS